VIFVDANVPIYLVGAPHPNKQAAQAKLDRLVASRERLVSDAEMLQELVHRYAALGRFDSMRDALETTLAICDHIYPVTGSDALRAAEIVRLPPGWSARDAIHLAVMERHGVGHIFSFDADFDRRPGIIRLPRG
jgi:predicted nucleic acid-binding protein